MRRGMRVKQRPVQYTTRDGNCHNCHATAYRSARPYAHAIAKRDSNRIADSDNDAHANRYPRANCDIHANSHTNARSDRHADSHANRPLLDHWRRQIQRLACRHSGAPQ